VSDRQADLPQYTKPPDTNVVLYDGLCKFCTAQTGKLTALARPGAVRLVNFQEPGVLEQFPGLTHEACMQAMHLITPSGRIYRGFEAAVQALATRPLLGRIAYLYYYVPGIRWLCEAIYRQIAAHRYQIMGKAIAAGECEGGTCALHAPKQSRGLHSRRAGSRSTP
jgi:predicted DCC family thiol-disulfide oxidoreductase YuxK